MQVIEIIEIFFFFITWKFEFNAKILKNIKNLITVNFFFIWKITNYADNYWFMYANKKLTYENRYVNN